MSSVTHDMMANAIRVLTMDAVEKAKSGHAGMPMGMADVATVLFTKIMTYDASTPLWPDRDRFVLSCGHGSMLIYSVLYLTDTGGMTMDDLVHFRSVGGKTPGHPEYQHTIGVETTTGPLGQGIATSVGMALAERHLNSEFGDEIVDHHTYVICSDGDLMEGISQEAIAFAGHLKLNRLIFLYDDNHISIDGATSLSDSVDQIMRFQACGWDAVRIDGHSPVAIEAAIRDAQKSTKPTLIACKTTIGFGAPTKAGTQKAHSDALGPEEIAGARKNFNWTAPPFVMPDDILAAWRAAGTRGRPAREAWEARLAKADAPLRGEFERRWKKELPKGVSGALADLKAKFLAEKPALATRKSSEAVIEAIVPVMPELIMGSADLTPSNNTRAKNIEEISPGRYHGRYIHYGIREHGMAACMNGMSVHGGIVPGGGTFLVFSDYCRPAIRIAAIMKVQVIYVFTHDSIGLGEDGPTHQPVEHLASLRAMPNLLVLRPADAVETAEAWQIALERRDGPTVLALSRQNLRTMRTSDGGNRVREGAYEVAGDADAKVSIFASGSEVELAFDARDMLAKDGISARIVSVPSMELFLARPEAERRAVIGNAPLKIGVEAAVREGWDAIIGSDGRFIGMKSFGESGPYKEVYKHFGITPEAVAAAAKA